MTIDWTQVMADAAAVKAAADVDDEQRIATKAREAITRVVTVSEQNVGRAKLGLDQLPLPCAPAAPPAQPPAPPVVVAPVTPAPQPPAAPPAQPPALNHGNPRNWGVLAWVFAILGGLLGLVIASLIGLDDWVRAQNIFAGLMVTMLWWLGWFLGGFGLGGYIGSRANASIDAQHNAVAP